MSRQVVELESLAAFDAHLAGSSLLAGCFVQSVDLTGRSAVLQRADPTGSVFLGCVFAEGLEAELRGRGALIFPTLPGLPFDPYRATLYDADELYADGAYADSSDAHVFAWAKDWHGRRTLAGSLAVALHDHAITDALDEVMQTTPATRVVGVMGGHAMLRGTAQYAGAARLGRRLTRAGFLVITGGGPGAMEAANLGAYLSGHDDDALDQALALLAEVPSFRPASSRAGSIDAWANTARLVRRTWPADQSGHSVGIPTWFYGHEPPNLFATWVAKYFLNPLREDTLLHRCRGGIVVLPGAAGTVQEIFQAVTENYYAAEDALIAPLVLVDVAQWTQLLPAWPLLTALGRDRPMGGRLHLVDSIDDVLGVLGPVT